MLLLLVVMSIPRLSMLPAQLWLTLSSPPTLSSSSLWISCPSCSPDAVPDFIGLTIDPFASVTLGAIRSGICGKSLASSKLLPIPKIYNSRSRLGLPLKVFAVFFSTLWFCSMVRHPMREQDRRTSVTMFIWSRCPRPESHRYHSVWILLQVTHTSSCHHPLYATDTYYLRIISLIPHQVQWLCYRRLCTNA